MTEPRPEIDGSSMQHLIDPRLGDAEDDFASPKKRSLFAIAGALLTEISFAKLFFACTISLGLPAIFLGFAPLAVSAWVTSVSAKVLALTEVSAVIILVVTLCVGWLAWRPLLRTAEESFWSLNALLVQPCYMLGTETLRHLNERLFDKNRKQITSTKLRAASSAVAGVLMFLLGLLIVKAIWPASRWVGTAGDLLLPHHLIVPTIANAAILISAYFAVVSLLRGFSDARTEHPLTLDAYDTAPAGSRIWRVVHLTDIHVVGEHYGFRIESGRAGPRGNERLQQLLKDLADLYEAEPFDLILVTGDVTDAGRASEWAEFFDAIERFPELAKRMVIAPGNHDLNISSRSNPAQIDLPFSSRKLLRQARALSAMNAVQGERVYLTTDRDKHGKTLREAIAPHEKYIAKLAEEGGIRASLHLKDVFHDMFPMIVPPSDPNSLGIAILNSNAESHFSFTNALGFVSVEQTQRLLSALKQYPAAGWIVVLHHHVQEYPKQVPFSIRIGTALLNGSWFIRKLRPHASRVVLMHGHRHLDWVGTFGTLRVVSGPSPVMNATAGNPTCFYIHKLVTGRGRIRLMQPQRVSVPDPSTGTKNRK
jgi:predicted MPP superfamily phosphohydrolase